MRRLAIIALLSGCSTGIDYDHFADALIDARCAYFVRCGVADSATECQAFYQRVAVDNPSTNAAIDDGKVEYHADVAQACFEAYAALSCDQTLQAGDELDVCNGVLTGTLATDDYVRSTSSVNRRTAWCRRAAWRAAPECAPHRRSFPASARHAPRSVPTVCSATSTARARNRCRKAPLALPRRAPTVSTAPVSRRRWRAVARSCRTSASPARAHAPRSARLATAAAGRVRVEGRCLHRGRAVLDVLRVQQHAVHAIADARDALPDHLLRSRVLRWHDVRRPEGERRHVPTQRRVRIPLVRDGRVL